MSELSEERESITSYEAVLPVTKDTNPKDAVGIAKVPVSVIPAPVMGELGLALMEGARKYGRHNYRAVGVRFSVYYDAAWRHLAAWWEGEDEDPDSKVGLHHVTKAIASLVVLRDAMLHDKVVDDRPPMSAEGWVADQNEMAARLIELFPDAKEPYVQGRWKRDKGAKAFTNLEIERANKRT